MALAGWICGMTGVGFILSGYLGGLFGWDMTPDRADPRRHRRRWPSACSINLYGVRFATMVNNIGVSLEFVITVGATILVAIVAFSSPENHQPFSVLFTGGTSDGSTPYILAWLAASLGPFFGLIGVEASADVAEETKNARHVIPRTMFYALAASIVIEFLMYVVYVLAIKDAGGRRGQRRGADRGDHHPAGRPGHHEDRRRRGTDERHGLHPGQHPGRHPADLLDGPRQHAAVLPRVAARVPDATARPPTPCSDCSASRPLLLLLALVSEKAFFLILGLSSLAVFAMYVLQTIALIIGHRRGTIPTRRTGHLRPRPRPDADLRRRA